MAVCTRGAPGTAGPRQRCGGVSARPRPLGASVAAPASPRPEVRPRVHAPHGDVHGSASADTCRGGSPRSPAEPGAPKTQAREKPGAPEGPPPRLGSHRVQTRVPAARSREGGGSAAQQRTRGTRPAPGKGRIRGPAAGAGCVRLVKGREAVNEGRKRVFFWLDVMLEKNFPLF